MSLIIAVVSASLAGSFLCSLCEASLYGVTLIQVEVLRRGRIAGSERLAKLRRKIDEPVAGIAAFNSMAQTVGATWVAALVGESYGNAWLAGVVQRRTIFDHIALKDCKVTLRQLMRPALFIPEDWGGHQLLDRLTTGSYLVKS